MKRLISILRNFEMFSLNHVTSFYTVPPASRLYRELRFALCTRDASRLRGLYLIIYLICLSGDQKRFGHNPIGCNPCFQQRLRKMNKGFV